MPRHEMGILKKRSTKSASFFCKVRSFAAAAACLKASTDCSTCPPCSNRQTGQRVSVREIRYRKQASTVRNTHSVLKKASYGTRRIFRSIRCKKQASTVRKGYSVLKKASWSTRRIFRSTRCAKTGFWGTEEIFGTGNALLRYGTKRPDTTIA